MKFFIRILAIGVFFIGAPTVFAATITVDTSSPSTAGDGFCSLSEAINNANNNNDTTAGDCTSGQTLPTIDVIEFAIPGAGPHTITTSSQFNIEEALTIDGTTQSGTVCTLEGGIRELKINIDGSGISSSGNLFNIDNDADNVTIKGLALYGNEYGSGIATSSNNTTIQCNNIGTDTIGLVAYPNGNDGVSIYSSNRSGHIFGGPNPGDGNLVSGNGISNPYAGIGLSCGASNILIQGNWIGVDITGQAILSNKNGGINCGNAGSGPYTNIQILDNVISGNGTPDDGAYSPGLNIGGSEEAGVNQLISNIIFRGNIVGLSADGTLDLGNSEGGIYFGATTADILVENNTISGNDGPAVVVGYDSTDVTIKGNIMGLATDGLTRIANTNGPIISIQGSIPGGGGVVSGIIIGGTLPGERNIISGGDNDAISIGPDVSNVTIIGNIIGPDGTGNTCIENNTASAITIGVDASQVTIGGATSAHRNIIGCSTFTSITARGTDMRIEGNYISVGADGSTDLATQNANQQETGMQLDSAAVVIGNTIKFNTSEGIKIAAPEGVSLIQNNIIQDNANAGIVIFGNPTIPDPIINILENTITNNGQIGIKIGTDLDNDYYPDALLTQNINDLNDTDTGPNGYLNHPVVLMTMQDGADTRVLYGLDVPIGSYRVEFFTNPTNGVLSSGFGEGEIYEDYAIVSKTTEGFETFTKTLTDVNLDDDITTTVTLCTDANCTDFLGTSEFSNTAPPGVDYDSTDYTASHVLNTIYLGSCVNGDNGDNTNTDTMGPNQVGAYLGTGPCTNDRDGVAFVKNETVQGAPSLNEEYTEIADTPSVDDATFSGTYDGDENNIFSLAFVSTAPGNGDDADYFIWIDTNDNIISDPVKVTPGVPQLLDHGIYVTFENGTGHTAFDLDNYSFGQVWQVTATIGGLIPSNELYTGTYTPNQDVALSVTASANGYVHIWVDNNQDGDFTDADEWIVVNEQVLEGANAFTVPAPSAPGTYNVRVRYVGTSTPDLLPTGVANDGEVEDYTFTVVSPRSRSRTTGSLPRSAISKKESLVRFPLAPADILGSGVCPANLIIDDLMKQGDRDGAYSTYNKKSVTEVKLLQSHINRILKAQYNQASGPEDGIFGPLTKQGVQRLQTALNTILKPVPPLVIDGIVGPFTRAAINNSCGGM